MTKITGYAGILDQPGVIQARAINAYAMGSVTLIEHDILKTMETLFTHEMTHNSDLQFTLKVMVVAG